MMKVTWEQLGKPMEPTSVSLAEGVIYVGKQQIDTWKAYPNAIYTIAQSNPVEGGTFYTFGKSELPDGFEW